MSMNSDSLEEKAEAAAVSADTAGSHVKIQWDDSNMAETYANIATILASQEEFSILFGTQKGLRPDPRGTNVQLTNRIMVNPFLAKRLHGVLSRTLEEYESRFGTINID